MTDQKDYSGRLCIASEPFNIYKDVGTIDSLVPLQIDPEEILFVISCKYHNPTYEVHPLIESMIELKFLYNGCIYQNQFKWGSQWALPIQEVK